MAEVAKVDIDGIEWDIRDDILTARFEQFLQQRETQRSYSMSEVNTGKKWIDGKLIYRRVYNINLTFSGQGWQDSRIEVANIDKIINSYCYGYDTSYNTQFVKFPSAGVNKATNNRLVVWSSNYGQFTQICIEYTKITD